MTNITWKINTCEHDINTGAIVVAHWDVSAVDGDYAARAYGTCGFTPDTQSETFKPYDQVTQEEVLSWVYGQINKEETEAALLAQIELDKHPTTVTGTPWTSATAVMLS
jgi:hypothetical protein